MLCSQSNKCPTCTSECYRYIMECHFNATLSNTSPRGDGNVKPCTGSIHNYLWVRKPRSLFLLYGVASSLKHLQQNTSTCFMKVYLIIRVFTYKHACEVVLHFPTWSFVSFLVNVFDIARFKRLRKNWNIQINCWNLFTYIKSLTSNRHNFIFSVCVDKIFKHNKIILNTIMFTINKL